MLIVRLEKKVEHLLNEFAKWCGVPRDEVVRDAIRNHLQEMEAERIIEDSTSETSSERSNVYSLKNAKKRLGIED